MAQEPGDSRPRKGKPWDGTPDSLSLKAPCGKFVIFSFEEVPVPSWEMRAGLDILHSAKSLLSYPRQSGQENPYLGKPGKRGIKDDFFAALAKPTANLR
jgi:hypothetical protein